jgi:hypothetical protein
MYRAVPDVILTFDTFFISLLACRTPLMDPASSGPNPLPSKALQNLSSDVDPLEVLALFDK